MAERRCDSGQHNWVCRTQTLAFGEAVSDSPLSKDVVYQVEIGAKTSEEVCPGGVIMCLKCDVTYPPNQEIAPHLPNLEKIIGDLKEE